MDEQVMARARVVANDKGGRTPLGTLTRDDYCLIIVPPNQEPEILQAVQEALKEKGIKVDAVWDNDIAGIPYAELTHHTAAEGWKELLYLWPSMGEFITSRSIVDMPSDKIVPHHNPAIGDFLKKHPEYTAVFVGTAGSGKGGTGGSHSGRSMGSRASIYRGAWEHINKEIFLSSLAAFPPEITDALDSRMLASFASVEEIRVSDPQGTYITIPVSEEEAALLAKAQAVAPVSHMPGLPVMAYRYLYWADLMKPVPFQIPKANGVIAGTAGHYGYYPHIKVFIRDGWIERVEGSGKMADLLREVLSRTRDVQYPGIPGRGWGYLNDIAIGSIPKAFRSKHVFDTFETIPNTLERLRSGVIHWGFGAEHYTQEFLDFVKKEKMPGTHTAHIHTYFNTYEVRFRGAKAWHKIIDRGHLTTLDDPEIRNIAAKYGDPDKLLKEEWAPKIPGVNYPGDYMRDYGRDPAAWIWRELNGLIPATIGVP